jgi:hypothetical protein
MSHFVGITRERVFSPGRVEDDRAIIELVAGCLRTQRHTVALHDGDAERWPEPPQGALIFAMCQGARAVERLYAWEQRGWRIINRPSGILNCQRHRTVPALLAAGVAFPQSLLLDTSAVIDLPTWTRHGGAWLKRGDVHATESADVVRVDDAPAFRAALHDFRQRGIRTAVVQRHVPGRVLKFYAVLGRYFHCVPPPHDGFVVGPEVLQNLDALGQHAARTLGVEIYGGDCVCDVRGGLTLIDLNDWPSYARCRTEGAKEIAAYLDAQAVATRT